MAFGLEVKTLRLQTNVFPHPHGHGWKKIDSPSLKLFFSSVSHSFPFFFFFFFLLLAAQRLHTSGTGALIDLWEQSKIEAETGDGGSFCTLSGDPREKKKGGQVYTK